MWSKGQGHGVTTLLYEILMSENWSTYLKYKLARNVTYGKQQLL